jgi:ABC-2 type transport system ATP-binding protein
MTEKRAVISLRNVRKSYGIFELGPMNLEVEPGYVVAIVGPHGGGKSTLMGMLMDLIRPTSGEVTLLGGKYPEEEVAIKRRIGFAPEHPSGHDDLSPEALREFVSHFYPRWDQGLYEDLLADVAMRPGEKFGRLSAGTQRRLTVALAMATGSELLLLDEPTAGLDHPARLRVHDDISRYMMDERYGERTVVFATRSMEEVEDVADCVALLVEGELLGPFEQGTLREGWKDFYVNWEPEGDVPGMVEFESGDPARIVSDSPRETEEALSARNVRIVRSGTPKLDEILSHLMSRSTEKHIRT